MTQGREPIVTNRIALLLAPLAAPAVLGLLLAVRRISRAGGIIQGADFETQVVIVSIPITYLIAIFVGYPVYFLLKRRGWLRGPFLFIAGAAIGAISLNTIIGLLLGADAIGGILSLIGAFLGASVAALYRVLRRDSD